MCFLEITMYRQLLLYQLTVPPVKHTSKTGETTAPSRPISLEHQAGHSETKEKYIQGEGGFKTSWMGSESASSLS